MFPAIDHCSYFDLALLKDLVIRLLQLFRSCAIKRFGYKVIAVFSAISYYSYFGLTLLRFCHKIIAVFFGLALLRFGYEVIAVISVMRY